MSTLVRHPAPHAFMTHPAIERYQHNPVLEESMAESGGLFFNAGVARFQERYVMIFRHDHGDVAHQQLSEPFKVTLGLAVSDDGLHWRIEQDPLISDQEHLLAGAYDPRLTVVDDCLYMCFAKGDKHGTYGGLAVTRDLHDWQILHLSAPDNRNMVLFPERIGGLLVRLERPFASYLRPGDRFDIFISFSPDGRYWGDTRLLLATESCPWVNNKIGPANPPIRTQKGWLAFYHGVDVAAGRQWGWDGTWNKRYSAGLMLLDLMDPCKVIGLSRGPVLVPESHIAYEASGYRDFVIFPGAMIAEDDGSVKIYYGAADTVVALAFSTVEQLLDLVDMQPPTQVH